jgi:putative cell wall-binding protein
MKKSVDFTVQRLSGAVMYETSQSIIPVVYYKERVWRLV